MRFTGMIRHLDDLGRIVIPKEIRKSMGITSDDPIEIFIDKEFICLRKSEYSTNYSNDLNLLQENVMNDSTLNNKNEVIAKISELKAMLDYASRRIDKDAGAK